MTGERVILRRPGGKAATLRGVGRGPHPAPSQRKCEMRTPRDMDATPPPYPLPQGHLYGVSLSSDLRFHDGKYSLVDSTHLRTWQARYRSMWTSRLEVSGRFDGPTQRAAVRVQQAAGLPVTGWIDRDTWQAVWTAQRPVQPPAEPPRPRRISKEQWDYWRKTSQHDITYGHDPDDPAWYPGRPFGRHESGWHVRVVQELLGVKPSGYYNPDTVRRVRGWQRAHDLPASGVIDSPTARHLDESVAARKEDRCPEPKAPVPVDPTPGTARLASS